MTRRKCIKKESLGRKTKKEIISRSGTQPRAPSRLGHRKTTLKMIIANDSFERIAWTQAGTGCHARVVAPWLLGFAPAS